jgi:two-component system chemotaxis response regulator CheB
MLTQTTPDISGCQVLLIGASAGAVEALSIILPGVPQASRIPIVVVVHLPPNRSSLLPELFAPRCAARVREPEDKQPITAGTIWFAPSNYHLLIEQDRRFSLSVDEPVRFSRPSIDVLFESAADAYGSAVCCVVLTGANDDGALGARAIRDAGGLVVVQHPDSAEAREMPKSALEIADPQMVLFLPEIAALLRRATETSS